MAKRTKYKPYKNTNSTSHNSTCKNYNSSIIMLLAYIHRYLFPIILGIFPTIAKIIGEDYLYELWGCAFLIHALYGIIGYKRKWKHIYCSYQNSNRQKMTPNHIHWDDVKKSDIYGMSTLMGCFGTILIIVSFFL